MMNTSTPSVRCKCFLRDRLGPPGRCSGCCRRRGFFLVIFRFGATMELEPFAATGSTRFAGAAIAPTGGTSQCRALSLSPTFPAGELVFFIPLRVAAGNPARRNSTGSGRLVDAAAPESRFSFW
jgi:hypothetical protein